MELILGIDDYRDCVANMPSKGKLQSWVDGYYSNHREVFDLIFRYLYRADLASMKPLIEGWDFDAGLQRANLFVASGGIERTQAILRASEKELGFHDTYRVFVLVGTGQVGGTVLPSTRPFLYIGAERWADDTNGLGFVVSHEFHHLARNQALGITSLDPNKFSFGDLLVMEGLATAFSILVQGVSFDTPNLKAALNTTDEALAYCDRHSDDLIQELLEQANLPVSPELMAEYLYSGPRLDSRGVPGNVGYYVGTRMVMDLLQRGLSMRALTSLPGQEVLRLWQEG